MDLVREVNGSEPNIDYREIPPCFQKDKGCRDANRCDRGFVDDEDGGKVCPGYIISPDELWP